jgi:hypothetical protein
MSEGYPGPFLCRESFPKGLTFAPNSAIVALSELMRYMPTLERFGSVSVRMYADDHRPPHFQIVTPDFQVLVRISDLAVIAGEARQTQIAETLGWAQAHQETLALKWAELNEMD